MGGVLGLPPYEARFGQRRALAGDPGLSDEAARREAVPREYPGLTFCLIIIVPFHAAHCRISTRDDGGRRALSQAMN
jgi:hypothetical protein